MKKTRKKNSIREEIVYLIYNNSNTIINVTEDQSFEINQKNPYFKGDSTLKAVDFEWKNNDTFPTFLTAANVVSVPKGVKRAIDRLPKKVLKKIDKNITVAKEKCLIVASSLTPALFIDEREKWKSLSSKILHAETKRGKDNTYVYQYVIEALEYSTTSTFPVIECKTNANGRDSYESGVISKQYRFSSTYQGLNLAKYELLDEDCINRKRNFLYSRLNRARKNPIANNMLLLYELINLPSVDQIKARGKILVGDKYKTKKGKLLTFLNGQKKSRFKNCEDRSYVEDHIKKFEFLTSNSFMIPNIGNHKSGGRVIDSFNLMPSWIREMCKIDREDIIELDYSAFHPNIAMSIYGGTTKFLTHEEIAKSLEKPLREIKIEHLSFFNKHPNHMIQSPLYTFYKEHEPKLLKNIVEDKLNHGYKRTSRRLFKKEVEIMTSCIVKLNSIGVVVMYVYDALYCKKSQTEIVKHVMNTTVIEHVVYTRAK